MGGVRKEWREEEGGGREREVVRKLEASGSMTGPEETDLQRPE